MDTHTDKDMLTRLVAKLESRIDVLETELCHIDRLMTEVGFANGIVTLKETAEELLRRGTPSD
ncbi:MAG: hypothetical protein OXF02_00480 [Simkaniaceae bacterium]|nr:hypothetical protein [Simkaniaceae bacterium]